MRKPFNGDFPLTQGFGVNPEAYKKFNLTGHNGLDFGLPIGTPVVAPHGGKIVEANFDAAGYGFYVKIEDDKQGSVLAHLSEIDVKPGFSIMEGEQIGLSGNSGNSTGAHLHWGWYLFPRNRENGTAGFIDQSGKYDEPKATSSYKPKYNTGDEIWPSNTIPVGSAPGKESISYGVVSPSARAKVVAFIMNNGLPYYNIDQSYIGGGTGWVRADIVDQAPKYTPSSDTPPPAAPEQVKYTESQYQDLAKKLEVASSNKSDLLAELDDTKKQLITFTALGYTHGDDVTNALNQKDDTIEGCNKQIVQLNSKVQALTKIVEKQANEDSTAIDDGMKAGQKLKEKNTIVTEVAKTLGTKPALSEIMDVLQFWKKKVDSTKNDRVQVEVTRDEKPVQKFGIDWLMSALGLGKEVS